MKARTTTSSVSTTPRGLQRIYSVTKYIDSLKIPRGSLHLGGISVPLLAPTVAKWGKQREVNTPCQVVQGCQSSQEEGCLLPL